jgi:hypothetical protein
MSMRGDERIQDGLYSYVLLEQGVPREHPLREIRKLTDEVLRSLSAEFDALYSDQGRPSIAPEYVLRALLLQELFSVRSERQVGRADRLQPSLPLVRRPGHGRRGVEPCGVLQEPGPFAPQRGGAALFRRSEPTGQAVPVRRSLHRGRPTDPGLGVAEELPPQGRFR